MKPKAKEVEWIPTPESYKLDKPKQKWYKRLIKWLLEFLK